MSRLYVVNCTAQDQMVYYRLDFSVDTNGNRIDGRSLPPKFQVIPAGEQRAFAGELFPGQAEQLIHQLEESMLAVHTDQIKSAKAKGVVRMLYSLDRPVPLPICKDVKLHNMGMLSAEGAQRRKNLAIAAEFSLRGIAEQVGSSTLPNLEMEVESAGQHDPEYTAPRLEEGIKVNATGRAPAPPAKRGPARQRAA